MFGKLIDLFSWTTVAVVVPVFFVIWFVSAFFKGRGGRYPFMDGEVHGVTGRMGQGKSLFVVSRVILPCARAMASKRGLVSNTKRPVERIISNFWMDLPYDVETHVLDGSRLWDDLTDQIKWVWDPDRERWSGSLNALVVIDEAHLYAPSGRMKMAPKAHWFCSMARKLNCEVWWITQHHMKVHAQLRRDSTYLWVASRGGRLRRKMFEARQYQTEVIDRPQRDHEARIMYRLNDQALSLYKSMDLIEPDEGVNLGLDSLSKAAHTVRDKVLVDPDDAETVPFGTITEPEPAT